ncbi:molybdopterin cofactor-binding domain-containing protein [Ekhidna sp. To15]|uniref:xanthine dehydrogenase family protein molybdopterin-binding subunit n=1 Tax=Ekhidna sp. To15 TaxID=3395267 RepID=UPI003F51D1F6
MTIVKTEINRRSFLKVSAAGSAGIMIGFNWLAGCASPGETISVPEEWFNVNAYITIADNGEVTIMSPNPEIGQNVKTSMPLIIAEELDVDWDMVKVEQAGLDTNNFKRQLAGGSQSIRQGWQSLRMAGAAARRLLMEAAAKKWQVSLADLSTDKGIIKNEKTGDTIGYGEIAIEAVSIPVPEEIKLKDPKDFKLIGQDIKNVDAPKIVTGQPLFGLDYMEEGATIAMIEHPPAFGMKLKSLDAEEAKAMPGIKDVFTVDTTVGEPQWSDVNAFKELVVITGESTWQVMKAKSKLKIDWEQDTPAESSEDHAKKLVNAMSQKGEVAREDGNPTKASQSAAQVVDRTFSAPFLAHNTLEPMNFFANVTADQAILVGPIQTPEYLRKSVSSLLGMPEENISIDMTRMGGGFGRRLYGHFGVEAAAISKKIGGPVKLIYKREDDLTQGTYRPAYRINYKAALDSEGKLIAFQAKGAGIPGSPLFQDRFPAGTVDNYKIENINIDTNISTGAWRAPRSNFVAGAEQAFLDEVAEAAGKDPIDFRLELFDRAINDPVGDRNDYDPARYAGVLKLVREKARWDNKPAGVFRGVSAYFCHNSYVAQVVDVIKDGNDLKLQKVWCAVDCGIVVNREGAINQIEGGIIDGIGHTMYSQVNFDKGSPVQNNFDQYRLIRHTEAPPEIEVFFVENGIDPTGLGEPSLPPIAAAVANAMYQATGKRWYHQPFMVAEQEELMEVG